MDRSAPPRTHQLKCSHPGCTCPSFSPSSPNERQCGGGCRHSWVLHAVDQLSDAPLIHNQPLHVDIVFDISSLILYGAQAIPIKLKILLDKLFAKLNHNEVLQIIYSLKWPYEDYVRGYKYRDGNSVTLCSWIMPSRSEEKIILQQFTRIPDTRDVAQHFIKQLDREHSDSEDSNEQPSYQSKLRPFISNLQSGTDDQNQRKRSASFPKTQIVKPVSQSSHPSTEAANDSLAIVEPVSRPSAGRVRIQCEHCPRIFNSKLLYKLHQNMNHQNPSSGESSRIRSVRAQQSSKRRRPNPSPAAIDLSQSGVAVVQPEPCPNATVSSISGGGGGSQSSNLKSLEMLVTTLSEGAEGQSFSPPPPDSEGAGSMLQSPAGSVQSDNSFNINGDGKQRVEYEVDVPILGRTLDGIICGVCEKVYKNRTCLKQHYNNVHLRLQHHCWVKGCNVSFPSKRSRDRHSVNYNLHTHLLGESSSVSQENPVNGSSDDGQIFRFSELFSDIGRDDPDDVSPGPSVKVESQ